MVSDFECTTCNLHFSVGGYHFHNFSDGYSGVLLAVCRCCSTQHRLVIALEDRGPEFYDVLRVTVTLVPATSRVQLMTRLRKLDPELSISAAVKRISETPFTYKDSLAESQARSISKDLARIGVEAIVEAYDKRSNPVFGPRQPHILKWLPEKTISGQRVNERQDWLSVEIVSQVWLEDGARQTLASPCQSCGGIETLLTEWPISQGCPNCSSELHLESEWIT